MATAARRDLDLSVVIPVYDERDNIDPLVEDVLREVSALGLSFEVILVNDGSRDGSAERLDAAAGRHPEMKVIHFACNCGQTLALAAGMDHARGKTIVCLDGDRQNDPSDIGRLLAKLDEGYACVSGWRKDRHDAELRRLASRAANAIVNRITGVTVHDVGCTLKAYRAGALEPRELFGEMHRFLVPIVAARGGSVAELVVRHHPRVAGISKYGMGRIPRVVADMLLVRVLFKYRTRPSHLLAKLAAYVAGGGMALLALGIVHDLIRDGALWFSGLVCAFVGGVGACVLLGTGIGCELAMRNRYLLGDLPPWIIARRVNFDPVEREDG